VQVVDTAEVVADVLRHDPVPSGCAADGAG